MQPIADPIFPPFAEKLQRVDSYAEIEEVMKSPDFILEGGYDKALFLGDTLIMSEGDRHRELQNRFAPLFSRSSIAYYELRLVEPVINEVLDEMRTKVGDDGVARADLVPLVHAALTRISARVTGVDGVDTPERTERFRQAILTLSEATTATFAYNHEELVAAGKKAMEMLIDEYLQSSLDRRIDVARRFHAGEIERDDLPRDVLMLLCIENDLEGPQGPEQIPYVWRHCSLFLTAAIKTTSHSLPHVFVHLDEWIEEHPEDRELLTDPDFLHRAVAESIRLHQTAPVRLRVAAKDLTLSTGREVAAGEMLALNVGPANMDPEIFGEDARYFNPHRELPKGMSGWGMAFGVGIHSCLGRNLVMSPMNKGDAKYGTHGNAVRIMQTLYERGIALDPDGTTTKRPESLHDSFDSVPIVIRGA